MSHAYGFSSWKWEDDTHDSVNYLASQGVEHLELVALKWHQFLPMVNYINTTAFTDEALRFKSVSFHLPSNLDVNRERCLVNMASQYLPSNVNLILHPDQISNVFNWGLIEDSIVVENMDSRKSSGQTVESLEHFFNYLPAAGFCFDIGHAQQVDPTMSLAKELCKTFGNRMREIHLSIVAPETGNRKTQSS